MSGALHAVKPLFYAQHFMPEATVAPLIVNKNVRFKWLYQNHSQFSSFKQQPLIIVHRGDGGLLQPRVGSGKHLWSAGRAAGLAVLSRLHLDVWWLSG